MVGVIGAPVMHKVLALSAVRLLGGASAIPAVLAQHFLQDGAAMPAVISHSLRGSVLSPFVRFLRQDWPFTMFLRPKSGMSGIVSARSPQGPSGSGHVPGGHLGGVLE